MQIIQVVNHAHNVKLFHFTFALPNPLNGYVGAEITEPVCILVQFVSCFCSVRIMGSILSFCALISELFL